MSLFEFVEGDFGLKMKSGELAGARYKARRGKSFLLSIDTHGLLHTASMLCLSSKNI